MNLKQLADYILENPNLWDYNIQHGIISLDNNVNTDISYLTVFDGRIELSDCIILNNDVICV